MQTKNIQAEIRGNNEMSELWRELHESYPEIRFVYDTKMAAFHSQLEELYAPENEWLWNSGPGAAQPPV